MKSLEYPAVVNWTVEQPGGTEFWNARGRVEFYEHESFCSVNFTGAVKKFRSEEEAWDFTQRKPVPPAERWGNFSKRPLS